MFAYKLKYKVNKSKIIIFGPKSTVSKTRNTFGDFKIGSTESSVIFEQCLNFPSSPAMKSCNYARNNISNHSCSSFHFTKSRHQDLGQLGQMINQLVYNFPHTDWSVSSYFRFNKLLVFCSASVFLTQESCFCLLFVKHYITC